MDRKLSRREFVKLTSVAAGNVLAGGFLNACATSPAELPTIEGKVHYPKLPGHKIQPPEHYGLEGCYTGIFMGHYARVGQDKQIDSYEEMVGKRPSFFMIPYRAHVVFTGTQIDALICPRNRNYQMLEEVAKKRVIPFISYDMRIGKSPKYRRNKLIKGKFDEEITASAQWLKRYGESYGEFFIRTMREINLSNWQWSGDPNISKKAWQHIWNIFEAEGANQYATWVFNPSVP